MPDIFTALSSKNAIVFLKASTPIEVRILAEHQLKLIAGTQCLWPNNLSD